MTTQERPYTADSLAAYWSCSAKHVRRLLKCVMAVALIRQVVRNSRAEGDLY